MEVGVWGDIDRFIVCFRDFICSIFGVGPHPYRWRFEMSDPLWGVYIYIYIDETMATLGGSSNFLLFI